jgi:2-C-methyl-D-erythritol 4-phosphate cytidylyltransferase
VKEVNMTATSAPFVSLLLLSGGVGTRSRHYEPKQFYELAGLPMIAHSIIPAVAEARIGEIVVNAPEGFEERTHEIMNTYCGDKPYQVVECGATRQESSHILTRAAGFETVVLHEAARPFVNLAMYAELIDCSELNAGFCYPIAYSMCEIDFETRLIRKGVSREKVFDIQLPQKFDRTALLGAHEVAIQKGQSFTEDSVMVVSMAGIPVISLPGHSRNRKVTDPEDFFFAEQNLEEYSE